MNHFIVQRKSPLTGTLPLFFSLRFFLFFFLIKSYIIFCLYLFSLFFVFFLSVKILKLFEKKNVMCDFVALLETNFNI